MSHVTNAFKAIKAAGESLRNAEFHLGLLLEKPREYDELAVRTHLEDVRIALGRASLALADLHAAAPKPLTDEERRQLREQWEAKRAQPPIWMDMR